MKRKIGKAIIGVFLIAFGIIMALNALEITKIDLFFEGFWTLFIIVPCFIEIFTSKAKAFNIFGCIIGILLLLASRDIITYKIFGILVLTMFIIAIGIKFIVSGFKIKNSENFTNEFKGKGVKLDDTSAVFSSEKLDYSGKEFHGTNLSVVFGGIDCDLRNAVIDSDVIINATAIFGGIDIFLPDNVNVKINSTAIFGGTENKKNNNGACGNYTVYVKGVSIFGGVDIK